MIRLCSGFFVVFCCLACEEIFAGRLIRFEELPELLKNKNENIQAAEHERAARSERTGRWARSFIPKISAQLGGEDFRVANIYSERGDFWRLQGSMNLYRGGRDLIEDEIRKSQLELAHQGLQSVTNQELRRARQFYWNLVAVNLLIDEMQRAMKKIESFSKNSTQRLKAGLATSADTLQFELQKTLMSQELKRLDLERDLLKNELSVFIGESDHKEIEVESGFPSVSLEKLPSFKANKQVEIVEAKEQVRLNELKQKQLSRWWAPEIDLYSSYGRPPPSVAINWPDQPQLEWTLGVRMNFDLGQGIEDQRESQSQKMESEALRKKTERRIRELRALDHELRHDLNVLSELIQEAKTTVSQAQNFLKLTENDYARGVKNGPDQLAAFQRWQEFRQRLIQFHRDYHLALVDLWAVTAQTPLLVDLE